LPDFVAASSLSGIFFREEMPMAEKKKKDSTGNNKVQFIVVREFAGKQTMKEAFEHLIEKQTCRQFEEWLDKKAS
jgi:hypothetical protein